MSQMYKSMEMKQVEIERYSWSTLTSTCLLLIHVVYNRIYEKHFTVKNISTHKLINRPEVYVINSLFNLSQA